MNNEIKELIEDIKYGIETRKDREGIRIDGYCLSWKNCKLILDYITNLQQENERLKKQLEYLRTDEYLNQVKWERNFNETMNKKLKTRIEKAVEYINTRYYKESYQDLLNILRGEDK